MSHLIGIASLSVSNPNISIDDCLSRSNLASKQLTVGQIQLQENFQNSLRLVLNLTRLEVVPSLSPSEYYFVTRDEMKNKIDKGEFIEHAEFSGNMYGTR